MADYSRSKSYSYSDDRMQVDVYRGPYGYGGGRSSSIRPDDNNMQIVQSNYGPRSSQYPNDNYFRSYSVSHAELGPSATATATVPQWKLKKSGSVSQGWSLNDPEFQRRKRVASYKVYSVEGKVKVGFKRSFRWIKNKYTQVVYGWW